MHSMHCILHWWCICLWLKFNPIKSPSWDWCWHWAMVLPISIPGAKLSINVTTSAPGSTAGSVMWSRLLRHSRYMPSRKYPPNTHHPPTFYIFISSGLSFWNLSLEKASDNSVRFHYCYYRASFFHFVGQPFHCPKIQSTTTIKQATINSDLRNYRRSQTSVRITRSSTEPSLSWAVILSVHPLGYHYTIHSHCQWVMVYRLVSLKRFLIDTIIVK